MSVSDCLLYGQYGIGIRINNPPSRTLISNVDIRHTYHYHMAGGRKNAVGMFTWAIDIEAILGNRRQTSDYGVHDRPEPDLAGILLRGEPIPPPLLRRLVPW